MGETLGESAGGEGADTPTTSIDTYVASGRLTAEYAQAITDSGFTSVEDYEAALLAYQEYWGRTIEERYDPRMDDLVVRLGRPGMHH